METILETNIEKIEGYDNPYVQVVWEDSPENFTQEKIKSVRHYFQKKYETTNVNIITKSKISDDTTQHNVDISFNILDKNYQIELVEGFLKSRKLEGYLDEVLKIDSVVDNELTLNENEAEPFKKLNQTPQTLVVKQC